MKKYSAKEIKAFVSHPQFDENIILSRDDSSPRISVVTPSYNQSQFLEETILSVLNQNYPNLEYIVVDGGSVDGSIDIIKKYEKYLSHWVSEKDNGQAHAINKGFRKSTGDILCWINSDDLYLPNVFSKVSNAFLNNPGVDLVFGNTYYINEKSAKILELRLTRINFAALVYEASNLHQPAAFWSREIYNEVKGIDPRYQFCMDFDFFVRIAKKGKLKYLREYLANFRVHKQSKTMTQHDVWRAERTEIIGNNFHEDNLDTFKFKLLRNMYLLHRLYCYFYQGDIWYILKKSFNRIIGITYEHEVQRAVGRNEITD